MNEHDLKSIHSKLNDILLVCQQAGKLVVFPNAIIPANNIRYIAMEKVEKLFDSKIVVYMRGEPDIDVFENSTVQCLVYLQSIKYYSPTVIEKHEMSIPSPIASIE
jgi:hypothetical protein